MKEVGSDYLEIQQSLNQDPLENIFASICLDYSSNNNNSSVKQFVDVLKSSTVSCFPSRGLCDTSFRESCASPTGLSINHGRAT